MNSFAISIYLYIAIGTAIALVFAWVHFNPIADEVMSKEDERWEYHMMIRQRIVLVICVIVTLWLPITCQALFTKTNKPSRPVDDCQGEKNGN
jgi:hypothetical protein